MIEESNFGFVSAKPQYLFHYVILLSPRHIHGYIDIFSLLHYVPLASGLLCFTYLCFKAIALIHLRLFVPFFSDYSLLLLNKLCCTVSVVIETCAMIATSLILFTYSCSCRSPSPEPIYNSEGKRLNTREFRVRKQLEEDRHGLIKQAIEEIPNYKPPADYKYVPFCFIGIVSFSIITLVPQILRRLLWTVTCLILAKKSPTPISKFIILIVLDVEQSRLVT